MTLQNPDLLPEIKAYVVDRLAEFDLIPPERRVTLVAMSDLVAARAAEGRVSRMVFICTHNSRRSHLCQFWAQAATRHFAVPRVEVYSGGTETSAFNPRAVTALRRAGFAIEPFTDGKNPVYEVSFEQGMEPVQAFSKIHDEAPNPEESFIAVMTCSHADAACPTVDGADARIVIAYEDPKAFDGTERETEAYDERCAQIAREMLYVFSAVAARS